MPGSPAAQGGDRLLVAALVVTHNRLEKLRVTLGRLLAEDLDHVLVFDNASTDGTGEYLDSVEDTRLIVVKSRDNLGGAGGFARGMRQMVESHDPDWIVVMDDDGRPFPGSIARFRALQPGPWDAAAAAVLTPSGQICEMNRPYRNPSWHLRAFLRTLTGGRDGLYLRDEDFAPEAPALEVDVSSFVGLFLSRQAIARTGLPDERLFIYYDDQLYTLQMRRLGLRLGFLPGIRFEHDTEAVHIDGHMVLRPLWKVYYAQRNALMAYRVASGPLFWLLVPLLMLKWHRRARLYGPDAARYRRIMRRACRDGLLGRRDLSHAQVTAMAEAD